MSTTPAGNHPAAHTKEATAVQPAGSNSDNTEVPPKLHTKALLAVLVVCFIYFAQDFALVGAGAVSVECPWSSLSC
jgi:hypothetical protein